MSSANLKFKRSFWRNPSGRGLGKVSNKVAQNWGLSPSEIRKSQVDCRFVSPETDPKDSSPPNKTATDLEILCDLEAACT